MADWNLNATVEYPALSSVECGAALRRLHTQQREHLVEERRSHLHAAERLEKRIKQLDQMMKPLDKDAPQR